MSGDIPQWAKDRAVQLINACRESREIWIAANFAWKGSAASAFARYIAEHEQPPVDPLLVEAREVLAERTMQLIASGKRSPAIGGDADDYRSGRFDRNFEVDVAIRALKRGMEIAK